MIQRVLAPDRPTFAPRAWRDLGSGNWIKGLMMAVLVEMRL
jgi:hypothetical protein